ncbi:hypothetical protein DdX_19164 [Ditylenchus destructor]|uniref:F-box domain-containing protein n=1 Tax=Ditylenchus destructor TaxID=166010 RepID=A0AAD4QUD1_9BILA|nr:hypothetical protein DdX_19164 [Ditylenchus destructor]
MECSEKLIVPDSNQIIVKRNAWNLLPLDIQIDVFRCLRAYDLYRNGRFVSCQWHNVIEQHRGMLPRFRQLIDCREQNRLIENNERLYAKWDAEEKKTLRRNRIARNLTWKYLQLIIISFIATLLAQPISAERITAKILLLMVSLLMVDTYDNIAREDNWFNYQHREIVKMLRPELNEQFRLEYRNGKWRYRLANGQHLPARVNIHAWFLVILNFATHLLKKFYIFVYHVLFFVFLYFWLPNGFTFPASISTFVLFCAAIVLENEDYMVEFQTTVISLITFNVL